jgi:hypothetical protein
MAELFYTKVADEQVEKEKQTLGTTGMTRKLKHQKRARQIFHPQRTR